MTIKIALITTFVASLTSPGCSWILVDAPPPQHEKLPYFDCTSGNGAPIVDTILAAGSAIGAIVLAVEGNNPTALIEGESRHKVIQSSNGQRYFRTSSNWCDRQKTLSATRPL